MENIEEDDKGLAGFIYSCQQSIYKVAQHVLTSRHYHLSSELSALSKTPTITMFSLHPNPASRVHWWSKMQR